MMKLVGLLFLSDGGSGGGGGVGRLACKVDAIKVRAHPLLSGLGNSSQGGNFVPRRRGWAEKKAFSLC